MKNTICFLSAVLVAFALSCGSTVKSPAAEAEKHSPLTAYIKDSVATVDTLDLVFYLPVNGYGAITTVRPLKNDTNVLFVCAAAFTLLENDAIDGLFIDSGNVKVRWVNHSLGGGIVLPEKSADEPSHIFGTDMGKMLDSVFIDSIAQLGASFFQQIQLVRDGQALRFQKEFSLFQRRALCMWHGELVVVETKTACTMQKFANVLKSCGIQNALYVDMGSWDEGWYRTQQSELVKIGLMRNETDRQSNWFVFRAK
jgi:hypothetical protein